MVRIYALVDPRTDEVRYIGKTKKSLHKRRLEHLMPSSIKHKTHKNAWLKQLQSLGLVPRIDELCICQEIEWEAKEQEYIQMYGNLTNATPGGDGVKEFTQEMKDKIAEANGKEVHQYSLSGEYLCTWKSVRNAARAYKVGPSAISGAASPSSRKRSSVGYQWSYEKKDHLNPYVPYHNAHKKKKSVVD